MEAIRMGVVRTGRRGRPSLNLGSCRGILDLGVLICGFVSE